MSDPYLYPGTTTLINRFDIRDPAKLQDIEGQYFYLRATKPLPKGSFDFAHLKAIHKHFFDAVYSWAGEARTVDISKQGSLFAHNGFIDSSLTKLFNQLHQDNRLHGMDAPSFCSKLAHYFNEVNAVHAFREGNGRTQRAFFEALSQQAGYQLDWKKVDKNLYLEASIAGFNGDNAPMTAIFKQITKPYELNLVRFEPKNSRAQPLPEATTQSMSQSARQALFETLKQEHPVLGNYDRLFHERTSAVGFKAEQIDKALVLKAREIIGDKALYERLQRDLPKFATALVTRIKEHNIERDLEC